MLKTIIDPIGRVVIGEVVSETDTLLTLNNPLILFVQPNAQTGQLQVQHIPYIFMEFLTPESRKANHWAFNKALITQSSVELDEKIKAQYKMINTPPEPQPKQDPEIIKLFPE